MPGAPERADGGGTAGDRCRPRTERLPLPYLHGRVSGRSTPIHSVGLTTSFFPVQISKRCEYALRILIDLGLAHAGGREFVPASELGAYESIPQRFLALILHELRQAGLVRSRRGKVGGYALSPKGRKARVSSIVRMTSGPLAPIRCVSATAYQRCSCPDETHCGLRMLMTDVRNAVASILDRHTIDDLVEITARKLQRDRLPMPFAVDR